MDINKQFSTNPYKHVPRSFITLVFFLKKFIRKTSLVPFAEFQFTALPVPPATIEVLKFLKSVEVGLRVVDLY